MPPGSGQKTSKKKSKKSKKKAAKSRGPRCHRCNRAIRVPDGWTHGPAIRRHYWAKHREVMQPGIGKGR